MRLLSTLLIGMLYCCQKFALSFITPNRQRTLVSSSSYRYNSPSSTTSILMSSNDSGEKDKLSIAILGGGISGLSCASQLLSQHKSKYNDSSSKSNELEVTMFDTGRLRPGGRCSSRLPNDKPAVVQNRSSGVYPAKRPCDSQDTIINNQQGILEVPENIQKAIYNYGDDIAKLGPVDHAAQILSSNNIPNFELQLEKWLEEGVVEAFPDGSVCELLGNHNNENEEEQSVELQPLNGEMMYYGKGGMGNIPITMRDYCQSFNGYGDEYTGPSFRLNQDVWVSPSNGVKYIGKEKETNGGYLWELRAGKKSLGKYHRLVISHNGKCADRIMSRTPAKAFHSLLRTKFAPYVPQNGGNQMTLNSIYSLVFAVKSEKSGGGGNGGLSSPIAKALSKLSSSSEGSEGDIYTVNIKNEPNLRLLSCNTLKHHHTKKNPNSESDTEVYTLLSSPTFGKKFKGPQENLPIDLQQKVTIKLLESLEKSLSLEEGSVINSVVDVKVQLWGAAVPMNTWTSHSISKNEVDGFVYDGRGGVGACGDWILDPSVAGAWESGRRLANHLLTAQELDSKLSVGLPDKVPKDDSGKFEPSSGALGSGIGTIPTSPNSAEFVFPKSNDQQQSNRPRGGGGRGGRGDGRGRGRGRGRGSNSRGDKEGSKSSDRSVYSVTL